MFHYGIIIIFFFLLLALMSRREDIVLTVKLFKGLTIMFIVVIFKSSCVYEFIFVVILDIIGYFDNIYTLIVIFI